MNEAEKWYRPVKILVGYKILRGIYNVRAGLVEYVLDGKREFVAEDKIVSSLLLEQAF